MRTIVCYGDSNTWGARPEVVEPLLNADSRYAREVRWPGVLRAELGEGYMVEEEGLVGRTTIFDDPLGEYRNGLKYINAAMLTNVPVDLVIIMLGTNDMKEYLNASAHLSARGVERLVLEILAGGYGPGVEPPRILIVSPPHIRDNVGRSWLGADFGAGCLEKDRGLSAQLAAVAAQRSCYFLDAADHAEVSLNDGVHLDAENHRKLGEAVAAKVREIFADWPPTWVTR